MTAGITRPEHAFQLTCAEAGVNFRDMLLLKISTNISVFAVTPGARTLSRSTSIHWRETAKALGEGSPVPLARFALVGIQPAAAQHAHHEERLGF